MLRHWLERCRIDGIAFPERWLRSGWGFLAVGLVIGFVGGFLIADWLSSMGDPEPAAQMAANSPAPPDSHAEAPVSHPSGLAEPQPAAPQEARLPAPSAVQPPARPQVPAPATPAWLRNAVPAPDPHGRPMIAVVIDDLGLNRVNAKRVIELPGPLTLAFMTYAGNLDHQTHAARAAGHELMVHFPMEPLDTDVDSGPNTLKADLPIEELRRRLDWGLSRFDGYVGVNNHMGSKFTGSEKGMEFVLEELHRRGLIFLDSRTTPTTTAASIAEKIGVPYIGRDVFLDNEASADSVRDQLAKTEAVARKYGVAIAIGHPHDGTIEALRGWLPTLSARGFALVPISAIMRRKLAASG